jgi:hypothetical protein
MDFATQPCHHGGKEPKWVLQFMAIPTNLFQNEMHIVIKDQGHPLQVISEARVPLNVFTGFGPKQEQIRLSDGGWIVMRSEFEGMAAPGGIAVV